MKQPLDDLLLLEELQPPSALDSLVKERAHPLLEKAGTCVEWSSCPREIWSHGVKRSFFRRALSRLGSNDLHGGAEAGGGSLPEYWSNRRRRRPLPGA